MDGEHYLIRLKGHLGSSSAVAFEGFTIRQEANGETILTGPVVDQSALHGILMKIRDLGLTLVEVKTVNCDAKL